jgi:hypothetical protein
LFECKYWGDNISQPNEVAVPYVTNYNVNHNNKVCSVSNDMKYEQANGPMQMNPNVQYVVNLEAGNRSKVRILGSDIVAIWDTGASSSLISKQMLEKCRDYDKSWVSDSIQQRATLANGQIIGIHGAMWLPIAINGIPNVIFKVHVHICEGVDNGKSDDMILLGADFMAGYNFALVYNTQHVVYKGVSPNNIVRCYRANMGNPGADPGQQLKEIGSQINNENHNQEKVASKYSTGHVNLATKAQSESEIVSNVHSDKGQTRSIISAHRVIIHPQKKGTNRNKTYGRTRTR